MNANSKNDPKADLMNDDYLWDRSGTPDPEIQRLETLLAEFRPEDRPLVLPAEFPDAASKPRGLLLQFPWLPRLAAAAVILLTISVGAYFALRPTNPLDSRPSWNVSSLEGAPQIGSQTVSGTSTSGRLHVGETLTTNSISRASITEVLLGEIRVDPNSRVRLVESGPNRKRIQLEVGTIHAAIWAPPTQFIVDTPSATTVDLGCAYTLQVAPDGSGSIRTTLGWVGFHLNGRDSFIPAGAMCSTRLTTGPGTPFFEDASPSFREALAQFDAAAPDSPEQSAALSVMLAQARPRDALSLWHLLSRTSGERRARVYDRLAALVRPPSGVTREHALQLDSHTLDLYWNALHLGDIYIWRFWEQSASPHSSPPPQMLEKKQLLLKQAP
jgi:hypothetical protein